MGRFYGVGQASLLKVITVVYRGGLGDWRSGFKSLVLTGRPIVEVSGMPNIEELTNRIAQLDPARQAVVERLVERLESIDPKEPEP
jgi:hypothetical protein